MGNDKFVGSDGYPCEFADSLPGSRLIVAISELPGADSLSGLEIERKARLLYSTWNDGKIEELARNRPASQKASEAEIRKFAKLVENLETHINLMHEPAISTLYQHGCHVFELAQELEAMREASRWVFHELNVQSPPRGAGKKIGAAMITQMASSIYSNVTGMRPTFTTDPFSGAVSGTWPDFLGNIFSALSIHASVASQARLLSEKMLQSGSN